MTFLPIVERELRVTSRRRGTFMARSYSAALMILIWVALSSFGRISPAQRGYAVFVTLAISTFLVCLLAGVFLTADSVAAERRDGTLGLLFLTELNGHDVVLGKLAGTSIRAVYGLLAVLPILALPLLTGGVTAGEFWRMGLVIVSGLFLSLALGLLVSVINHDARTAMLGAFMWLLMLTGLPWFLSWLVWCLFGLNFQQTQWLLYPSPVFAFMRSFASSYRGFNGAETFWFSLGVIQALGLIALVLASLKIKRVWQEVGENPQTPAANAARREIRFGSAAWRRGRKPLLDENPFFWLATRDRGPMFRIMLTLGVLVFIWAGFWAYTISEGRRGSELGFTCAFFIAYGLHVLLKGFFASEASRRFLEDRQSGALELLLVTPMSVNLMIAGQLRALKEMFRWPIACLCAVNLGLLVAVIHISGNQLRADVSTMFFVTFIGGTALLFFDFAALCWMGMWIALEANRHHQAVARTLRRIMLIPWLAFGIFFFLIFAGGGFGQGSMVVMILLWSIGGVFVSSVAKAWVKENLGKQFRERAANASPTTSPGMSAAAPMGEPEPA